MFNRNVFIALIAIVLPICSVDCAASGQTAATAAGDSSIAVVLEAHDVERLAAALDGVQSQLPATAVNARRISALRNDLAHIGSVTGAELEALSRQVIDALDVLSAEAATSAAHEEFGIRTIAALGTPECPKADAGAARCANIEWLATDSTRFHAIRKLSYLRGSIVNTVSVNMSASFVADAPATSVAIVFAAEALVQSDAPLNDRRLFVRALLDGKPAAPGDVVFATRAGSSPRSFIFTAQVDAGIHTVEMQWRVDPNATARMRDASLLVRTGVDSASGTGSLVVKTPASGASIATPDAFWKNVPGMSDWIYVPANSRVVASMSAESFASNGRRIALRAVLDNAVLLPSDVVFAKGATPQSRAATFAAQSTAMGWHKVVFQWLGESGGVGYFGDRSLALSAYPSSTLHPSHPVAVAPSGPNVESAPDGSLAAVPGMLAQVHILPQGNGEIAVQFSAEIATQGGASAGVVLAVDDKVRQFVTLSDGVDGAQLRTWVFEAKHLTAGTHKVQLFWYGGAGPGFHALIGDRIMAVSSETGFIPDLAAAPRFGGGHIGVDTDNIGGVEALIGRRDVLTILIDPHNCDAGGLSPPDCYDQDSVPKGKVESALYGWPSAGDVPFVFEPDNVQSYFDSNSHGRFGIANAGVLGWYDAAHPPAYYSNHPGTCTDGFENASLALFKEAVLNADADVDFAAYDNDSNGRLDSSELAIVVVIPRPNGNGSQLVPLLDADCDGNLPLFADGVQLPQDAAKVNLSLDAQVSKHQFSTIAHELMHLIGGLDDLHFTTDTAVYPRNSSLMATNAGTSTHLDPMHKLALGWVTPRQVRASSELVVDEVKLSDTVYILPRYNHPHEEEFFIVENRRKAMGAEHFDALINDSGIGIWHVVSDRTQNIHAPVGVTTATWEDLHFTSSPAGSQGQMGRNGLRLIRPFQAMQPDGTAIFVNSAAKDNVFWDKTELSLLSGPCAIGPTTLTWSDCTASGYSVDFLSFPSNAMTIAVTVE